MTKESEELIISKELREQMASHYEVLEKVKQLLLIPDTDTATINNVANYYEVDVEAIQKIYQKHKDEFDLDGVVKMKSNDFLNWTKVPSQKAGSTGMLFENGITFYIGNAGIKVFPRRAILRVGMLLRDSQVAKEVRTQLLNIEEKTSSDVKTQDIDEEQKLQLSVGMAWASGDINAFATASSNYIAFKNRYIDKQNECINKLQNDNKALAGEILEWKDRNKLNAGIRKLAFKSNINFGEAWNELYKNLRYKYGIALSQRGNRPYIQNVRENEWDKVLKVFSAMCESYGQSATNMIGLLKTK